MEHLITYQDIIDNTPIQGAGGDKVKKLSSALDFSHRLLKAILCDTLYDEMIAAYNVPVPTPTPGQAALFAYSKDFLVWASFKAYLGFSQFTDTDNGFRVFTENTSIEARPMDIRGLQDNAGQFVDMYKSELLAFLQINVSDYASWAASSCNTCKKKPVTLGVTGAGGAKKRVWSFGI